MGNRPDLLRRNRGHLGVITLGAALLVVGTLLVREPAAGWEVDVFRLFNDLPHSVEPVLWGLQQMGSAVVLPIVAVVMWVWLKRWQPPVVLLAGGFFLGWWAAKGIKAIVDRGRPAALLDEVELGFDVPMEGFGFPSGHAVLAFTLAAALAPYLSRRWRIAVYAIAIGVALTRIYVGAHMPLDIVGGAGWGLVIGSLVAIAASSRLLNRGQSALVRRA